MDLSAIVLLAVVGVTAGLAVGYFSMQLKMKNELGAKRAISDSILHDAKEAAEREKREKLTEAKEEALKLRQEVDREMKDRRNEVQRVERRLEQKEETLDKKIERLSHKEEELKQKHDELTEATSEIEKIKKLQSEKLETVARMTQDEAREVLLNKTEEEAQYALGMRIKELEEKAKRESDKRACDIIVSAIQRTAAEHAADATVSVVPLPSDEMKGRIIGREGRNIKAFETLTGVDLIVDDTPEAVTLSSFDPMRREIARLALEKLIIDGRIHPARIEELLERAARDVDQQIIDAGEAAILEAGIKSINSEITRMIGSLKFRFSYGQNALAHSLEVAHIAGIIAAELGVDVDLARRSGLLHDLGKSIDHQVEGAHASIGADIARRYGEKPEVTSAIAAHHENIEQKSINDVIVAAADAISASRPGARRESIDAYVKRLEKLEEIAQSFPSVSKAYAIQAGREVRVLINPTNTDDGYVQKIAYDVARKVEEEMKYPGQIKINVSREMRAMEYAK